MAKQTAVQIDNGDIQLEGVLRVPDEDTRRIVVVCHPHPQSGGTMDNNVVMLAVDALLQSGIAALTFNFRGVGRSTGAYDGGVGEQSDVRAAIAYARTLDGIEVTGLAGYSFGARMAAAIVDESIAAVVLVSAPTTDLIARNPQLAGYEGPILFVTGELDHISSTTAIEDATTQLEGAVEIVRIPSADHFWWGHEPELVTALTHFFASKM